MDSYIVYTCITYVYVGASVPRAAPDGAALGEMVRQADLRVCVADHESEPSQQILGVEDFSV